ncbi:phosphopantetheine-binding protein, partial [Nonomuraea sp. NPDC046570]|uniref:phosphopantetheine-binding protein n=1 Tax=Nonomuraea sp. NPDC046570 TaxID=3155255 RepID=UPI003402288C
DHMIPTTYTHLDHLPTTPNGKLDRKALPAPQAGTAAPSKPPSGVDERAVAEVWAEVLRIDPPGAHDGFFALGGDSIRSLKVVARLRARGYSVEIEQIFLHQTVRELAGAITKGTGEQGPASEAFGLLGAADLDRVKRRFQGGTR